MSGMTNLKNKWTIFLKFYNTQWKPYFHGTDTIHCYDYEVAKDLYDKLCKNFSNSQWMLVKLEHLHSAPFDKFEYIKEI